MSAATTAVAVLLGAGTMVTVGSTLAATLVRDPVDRVHFLAPITTVGGPAVGLALAVDHGWSLASAEILVTVALLAVTGAGLTAATGRSLAERTGLIPDQEPG